MSDAHHAEWLSLLDVSGPFLSPPVLDRVFPQGLDAPDTDHSAKLRLAFEEWAAERHTTTPDPAIHDQWIRLVLTETLEYTPEVLLEGGAIPAELVLTSPEHGETLRPDFVVFDPKDEPGIRQPRLLISIYPHNQELDEVIAQSGWAVSPAERMVQLCRANQIRLGLVTNGEQWMLVDAPEGETSGLASWYASLWSPEPLTLRAFRSLLGVRRFFGVTEADRLGAMLADSATFQAELTDQMGVQVRRAVEVLVQAIDRADTDTGRTLLRDIPESRIYEAALTVMMRLVFLFSAEERDLLLLGDPIYDQHYAVSTLRAQLREAADQVGEEVLERREDAWSRLLAMFRAIYGGVDHESLHLRAYGSSLFDPDRFPFLEGRTRDTTWTESEAEPLHIDNRTVLLLLESLQMLDLGKNRGARKLSFRALDIEQIGHVYETLLDHTAKRATEPMLSLHGNQGLEPEISVSRLLDLLLKEKLVEFLKGELKKGASPIRNAMAKTPEPDTVARLRAACGDDTLLAEVLPFHDLIRADPWGDPVVIRKGAVFVTAGEDRRSTGTHYTPRALTEEIVQYALEPVVYRGPVGGKEPDEWDLKSPSEILDLKVCDPAMGSGAFLVQACRYLSERLVEAWAEADGHVPIDPEGNPTSLDGAIPTKVEDRLVLARKLVADRCLYGVDINPLAVEMAKLSIWLITLANDTAFSFLDHAFKCGDSLLGVYDLDQLRNFHPDPEKGEQLHQTLFDPSQHIDAAINKSFELRRELEAITVRDVYDAARKAALNDQANRAVNETRLLGDLVIAAVLGSRSRPPSLNDRLLVAAEKVTRWLDGKDDSVRSDLVDLAQGWLNTHAVTVNRRRTFHWAIEFPEVFEEGGFDALVMNPPFLGGQKITGLLGTDYREYLIETMAWGKRGLGDLAAYFILRTGQLIRAEGVIGSLATNTIGQGDTREVGLGGLLEHGFRISRAVQSRPWPGSAALSIAQVWLTRSGLRTAILDGIEVHEFSSSLDLESRVAGNDWPLPENRSLAFEGFKIYGNGFTLTEGEAQHLMSEDVRNREVLRPYLSGIDLTSRPDLSPSRWVIDFVDWALSRAERYAGPMQIVKERVRPERERVRRKATRERWWRYGEVRPGLRTATEGLDRVIAFTKHSKAVAPAFIPTSWAPSHAICVIAYDDYAHFALLAGSLHWWWAALHGSSLEERIRYTSTTCFETFPWPPDLTGIELYGQEFDELRGSIMRAERTGGVLI